MKKYGLALAALLTMTSVNAGNKGFLGPRSEGRDGGSPAARARSAFNEFATDGHPPAIRAPGTIDETGQEMSPSETTYAGASVGGTADEEDIYCGCCSRRTANWWWNALARVFMGRIAEE